MRAEHKLQSEQVQLVRLVLWRIFSRTTELLCDVVTREHGRRFLTAKVGKRLIMMSSLCCTTEVRCRSEAPRWDLDKGDWGKNQQTLLLSVWFLDPSEGAISLDQLICVPTFTSDHELWVVRSQIRRADAQDVRVPQPCDEHVTTCDEQEVACRLKIPYPQRVL